MSTERITELSRVLTREELAKKLPGYFLVITDSGEEEPPSSFETVDAASAAPRMLLGPRIGVEIHEIVKAKGNPYPERISVGRARNCDVVLRQASVSKLHAVFLPQPDGQLDLVDVGSQIGTRVNGRALEPNQPVRVGPGFVILLGRVAARLADARVVWDLLKAQEQLEQSLSGRGSSPPGSSPRGSSPGSGPPAPRASSPGSSLPPPRPSSPGSLLPPSRPSSPSSGPPPPGSSSPGSGPGDPSRSK